VIENRKDPTFEKVKSVRIPRKLNILEAPDALLPSISQEGRVEKLKEDGREG
jgi:hypothetical protein